MELEDVASSQTEVHESADLQGLATEKDVRTQQKVES